MKWEGLVLGCSVLFASVPAFAQMSDADKKAAARAAFTEGTGFQDKGKWADALADFQKAESLFDAPTHLLHIAECQAQLGQLVEASETYESLIHKPLDKGAPDAFVKAEAQGDKELTALKPRIPTLRINVKPDPATLQNLQIKVNDKTLPAELVGIARPINPGSYQVTATATDYGTKTTTTVDLQEKEAKSIDLTLEKGAGTPAVTPATTPPTTPTTPTKPSDSGVNDLGLLAGLRPTLLVPFGKVDSNTSFKDYAGVGAGLAIDGMLRVAKNFLVGLTLEADVMKGPATFVASDPSTPGNGGAADIKVTSEYLGLIAGYTMNPDGLSPLGTLHGGYRFFQRSVTLADATTSFSDDVNGALEIGLDAGVAIPAGPIRIVPMASLSVGETSGRSTNAPTPTTGTPGAVTGAASGTDLATDGSIFLMIGLSVGIYYSADFGKKP